MSERGLAVLLAYYAPPAVGIASQRMAGFVRHLPEFGWDPVVVAPEAVHYSRSDESALPQGVPVIRVPNPEPSRWLRRAAVIGGFPEPHGAELRSVARSGWTRALREAVRQLVYIPDAQALWIPGATKAAVTALAEGRGGPAVIFSSSVPFSAHFAARRASRRTGIAWVAEYRDPWSVAPPQFGRRWRLRQKVDERLDHDIVSAADALIFTSHGTADEYRQQFGQRLRAGVTVVRNGFDAVLADAAPSPEEPVRLVYSGTLLHPSYAAPLLSALETLHGESPGAMVLDVYGPTQPWLQAGLGAGPWVRLHGVVPPREMAGHLASASALVLLQPDPSHAQYVAGKLYEYLGARRPLVAALPPACEAERLIQAHGEYWPLARLDAEHVLDVFRRLVTAHRDGKLDGPRVSEAMVAPLTRRSQTVLLAQVFDAVGRGR